MVFVSGGDIWVMDTVLKTPKAITQSASRESNPLFSPNGDSILYLSHGIDGNHIWRVERKNKDQYWWQNNQYFLKKISKRSVPRSQLTWSPDGSRIAFIENPKGIWTIDPHGENPQKQLDGWYFRL